MAHRHFSAGWMKGDVVVETIPDTEMLAQLLQLYRVQRHDFLNHFQVAMGYLQMGKNQAALEYLRQAAAESIANSSLSQLRPPEFAVELMLLASSCFKYGVEFHPEAPEEMPEIDWSKSYSEAIGLIRELVPGLSRVDLGLDPVGKAIRVVIAFTGLSEDPWKKSLQAIADMEIPIVEVRGESQLGMEFTLGGLGGR